MTRKAIRLAQLPLAATAALVVALLWLPGRRELSLHVYLLVLGAFALLLLARTIRRATPVARTSPFDSGLRRPRPRRSGIEELERLERELTLSGTTAFDVHLRLRPHVRRIAAYLLASRRGIDLDGQPERARRLLGEQAMAYARQSEAGMLHVNIPTLGGEAQVPFGGTKGSGLGFHECGEAAFDFFTEERIVYVAG